MFPAARVGDPITHDMLVPSGLVGPPLVPDPRVVLVEGLPAAFVTCSVVCSGATSLGPAHPPPPPGPPVPVLVGSPTVLINGKPAARWVPSGDLAACGSFLGDAKLAAARTVLIGGPGAPPGMPFSIAPDGSLRVGNSITVQGTDEFKAEVANRLQIIGNTTSGQTILKGIESSGKKMNMVEFKGPNSFAGPSDFQAATPSGKPVFYGNGQPMLDASGKQVVGTGTGSDVTVQFNPNLTLPNNQDPTAPMPNDAILFHEMKHGDHQMNANYDGSPKPGWTTEEEHTTIRDDPPSEADYLKERDYPWRRTGHGTDFEPNP